MQGLQLVADLRGCAPGRPAMSEPAALREACLGAVDAAGLVAVGEIFHRFAAAHESTSTIGGITGVVVLAESHLAVHTWPEIASATIDVYVCNFGADNSAKAKRLLDSLIDVFAPKAVERHALGRGQALGRGNGPCLATTNRSATATRLWRRRP